MSIRDSDTAENCDEICVHLDGLGLLATEVEILSLLGQRYYMLFGTGRMKDNNLILNSDIHSEFLILISNEN